MENIDSQFVIDGSPFADVREEDADCEFRFALGTPLPRFAPGRDREREEIRALQEYRRRHAGIFDEGRRNPPASH